MRPKHRPRRCPLPAGEPTEAATGLLSLRARHYHPALGRFLTPDALIPDVTNGQAWNRYAYVYNDPTTFVDPSGHNPWLVALLAVGTVAAFDWGMQQSNPGWWNAKPLCRCHPIGSFAPGLSLPDGLWMGAGASATAVLNRHIVDDVTVTPFTPDPLPSYQYRPYGDSPTLTARLLGSTYERSRGFWNVTSGTLGVEGGVAANALLGGLFQFAGDVSNRFCLSPRDLYYRAAMAMAFAVPVGLAGTVAAALTKAVLPKASPWVAAVVGAGTSTFVDQVLLTQSGVKHWLMPR